MINQTKCILIVTLAAVSIASPALAQSFNVRDGTGNVMSFSYGADGTRIAGGIARQQDRSGLHAFAQLPRTSISQISNTSGATGGGSAGYNQLLLQH